MRQGTNQMRAMLPCHLAAKGEHHQHYEQQADNKSPRVPARYLAINGDVLRCDSSGGERHNDKNQRYDAEYHGRDTI